jgi:hypothetical protein
LKHASRRLQQVRIRGRRCRRRVLSHGSHR